MRAAHYSTDRKAASFMRKCQTLATAAALTLTPAFVALANDPTPTQRLDELHAQFTETLDREVMTAHEAAAARLRASYLTALEQALVSSTKAANLGDALALREEIKRLNNDPEAKPATTEPPPPALARLKEKYEGALARLEVEKAKKSLPYYAMYTTVLTNYQKDLTKKGDLDGASSVQERLKEVAQKKPIEVAKPGDTRQAKVEIENINMELFKKGGQVYGDTDRYTWEVIPERFAGYRFSRPKDRYIAFLRFKVVSDGAVTIACTNRWADGGNDGPWKNEVISQEQLESQGWKPVEVEAARALNESHSWVFLTRDCKAGESFAIRTEKYASPLILLKN
jgi:hypothetical protein